MTVMSQVWDCVSYANVSPSFGAALAAYSAIAEPKTYNEALRYAKWIEVKYTSSGAVERLKARLVAKEYSQQEGLDSTETFSPVAKMVTIRSVLVIVAAKHWAIFQMDVHNTFLQGDLLEEVYMEVPPGLDSFRVTLIIHCSPGKWSLVVLVYVDDLLITGSSQTLILQTRNDLKLKFKMKDLGELKFFLGIEFARLSKGIVMSQRKYALELIAEIGLSGAKPAGTPLEANVKLTSEEYDRFVHSQSSSETEDKLLTDAGKYQRLIGRYIKGSPGLGLLMPYVDSGKLEGFCDSDWGGCLQTIRSVTCYLVKFGDALISWKSKKQENVARSSTKPEFRSMASAVTEFT
uniref:Uncharacterized mitochondrial protein AtMg00810-like n=1 Tax=Nicotiana tabacum TaxID=4097 RepID=A0A1S4CRY0_TOBAC|nr:PREDICTED: uncharacterized mitochondrial protein AtMg00810-like [Nicotiana tabacum]